MEVEFWPAATLRHDYDLIASFYQIEIGKEMFQCRNHALIFRKGLANQQLPDAVIVMANPGSCCPKDPNYQPPILKTDFINASYVEVKDDPTQQQLMRLMKLMHWNVISIINLSDLCSGNMDDFAKKLRIVQKYSYLEHSIFSDKRDSERDWVLKVPKSKLILAWGKHTSIQNLAGKAGTMLQMEKQSYGLRYSDPSWGFRHPYPMIKPKCIEWLKDMYMQLTQETIKDERGNELKSNEIRCDECR